MKRLCFGFGMTMVASSLSAQALQTPVPGTYTNEEQVYFDKDAGRAPPPWVGVTIARTGAAMTVNGVDAFGKAAPPAFKPAAITAVTSDSITVTLAGGVKTVLRRARDVTCWGSIPKTQKKADGSDDWIFVPGLKMHDQGGRVRFGGGDSGAPEVVLRMRNVIFATSTNRPSVVLYVHKPDDLERAVSYTWGDPDVSRLGVNLRWMQASCTISKGEMK